MDAKILYSDDWSDVGVHPTPVDIVSEFASATVGALALSRPQGTVVRVLDACAGDGRLGRAVSALLLGDGYIPELVLLDTRRVTGLLPVDDYSETVVTGNVLSYDPDQAFDLVVSNPPYQHLSVDRAEELGLDWSNVRMSGRNLYGMVMSACLEMCLPGGICSFIAPQGWLRNVRSTDLRANVSSKVSTIRILAFQSRKLFPSVVQDTAIQIMKVKSPGEPQETSIRISYDRAEEEELTFSADFRRGGMELPRVRVGPLVWNRHDPAAFVERGGYRVLYGGNISTSGTIDWTNSRYIGRRRVRRSSVPEGYVSRAPYIAIKRVMRGGPGAWMADVVAELDSSQECVAENHVIIVELPMGVTLGGIAPIVEKLKEWLEMRHKDHGHPNLSAGMVRELVAEVSAEQWLK